MEIKKNSPGQSYYLFWKNTLNFKGRTRRSDYWNVYIINALIMLVLSFLNLIDVEGLQIITTILSVLYSLLMFVPQISITVRRLHDVGKDGYYILLGLVPIIGQIFIFINLIKDSQKEKNKFSECTKYCFESKEQNKDIEFLCPICQSKINADDYICSKCGSAINREESYE